MLIISVEIMKTTDKKEMQKTTKEKQTKTEMSNGNRSYSERVRANWFCCAFQLGFLQLICKASLIFKLNLESTLSIILKQRYNPNLNITRKEPKKLSFLLYHRLILFLTVSFALKSME